MEVTSHHVTCCEREMLRSVVELSARGDFSGYYERTVGVEELIDHSD